MDGLVTHLVGQYSISWDVPCALMSFVNEQKRKSHLSLKPNGIQLFPEMTLETLQQRIKYSYFTTYLLLI